MMIIINNTLALQSAILSKILSAVHIRYFMYALHKWSDFFKSH